MLNIEQDDKDRILRVSAFCDDCECELHPSGWIDDVHCRCGAASCDSDTSSNHDGLGCFARECECLPLPGDYYIVALEIYLGLHPEAASYKIVGETDIDDRESIDYPGDGEFYGIGENPKESLRYAVSDTILEAAQNAGIHWPMPFSVPKKATYSEAFFADWRYEVPGGMSLIVGIQEDRTLVLIQRPSENSYSLTSIERAVTLNIETQSRIVAYLTEMLLYMQDAFRLDQRHAQVMMLGSGFSLWGQELQEHAEQVKKHPTWGNLV